MSTVPFRQIPQIPLSDMRRRVPVSMLVGLSPYGELFVLVDDETINRAEVQERVKFEQSIAPLDLPAYETQAQRAEFIARRALIVRLYKVERDATLHCARWLQYVLVLPHLDQWQRILNAAFTPENGSHEWNATSERRYRELLLLDGGVEMPDGQVLSEADLYRLDPAIAETLGDWLAQLLASDPRKVMLKPLITSPRVAPESATSAAPVTGAGAASEIRSQAERSIATIAAIQACIDALNKGN